MKESYQEIGKRTELALTGSKLGWDHFNSKGRVKICVADELGAKTMDSRDPIYMAVHLYVEDRVPENQLNRILQSEKLIKKHALICALTMSPCETDQSPTGSVAV